MSATRDKTQNFKFVYSNLYQLYKKGKEAAHAADVSPELARDAAAAQALDASCPQVEAVVRPGLRMGRVLKATDLNLESKSGIRPEIPEIKEHAAPELLTKRIELRRLQNADTFARVERDEFARVERDEFARVERDEFARKEAFAAAERVAQAIHAEADSRNQRVIKPAVLAGVLVRNDAIESLKENLRNLNNLHARLRFMLTELEDLVKE